MKGTDLFANVDHFAPSNQKYGLLQREGYLHLDHDVPVLSRPVGDIERLRKSDWEEVGRFLTETATPAALVRFENERGFRWALARLHYRGRGKPLLSDYRRSYLLYRQGRPNKTFTLRWPLVEQAASVADLEKAFSLLEVNNSFYKEFAVGDKSIFNTLIQGVRGLKTRQGDFVLGFVARVLFLGFVAKRGWLGGKEDFLPSLLKAYKESGGKNDRFYREWLAPLFFQALKAPPGRKALALPETLPGWVRQAYQQAPYLNGDLFIPKPGLDDGGAYLTDAAIEKFFDFLFSYNFTIEENTRYEETLELNPEFLGLILERLVNAYGVDGLSDELGAHYTPRPEVDLMARLALAEWLSRKGLPLEGAYRLLHPGGGSEYLSEGDRQKAKSLLQSCKVLDPAVGSGAFLVGALQVLEEALERLGEPRTHALRRRLIANFYGVDPLPWAVWMTELRLWLSYFVDLPDEARNSESPLLPSLGLNVRVGDSALQAVGDRLLPSKLENLTRTPPIEKAYKELVQARQDYYENRGASPELVDERERALLEAALTTGTSERLMGGDSLELPANPPFLYLLDFSEVTLGQGGFDVILANPPYVRQEEIADVMGGRDSKSYKTLLAQQATEEMQRFPAYRPAPKSVPKPAGRSDLYVYFFVRAMRLLNEQGVGAFVTSNSWLDVQYGGWLKQLFLHTTPLRYVIENQVKRSFQADVNTVIAIFHAPGPKPPEAPLFVAVRKPFEESDVMGGLLEARLQEAKA